MAKPSTARKIRVSFWLLRATHGFPRIGSSDITMKTQPTINPKNGGPLWLLTFVSNVNPIIFALLFQKSCA